MDTLHDFRLMESLLQGAHHALTQRQYASALNAAAMSANVAPMHAEPHCMLGNIRLAMGNPELAIPHFETALRFEARHPVALANLGHAYVCVNKLVPARNALDAAVIAIPTNGPAWRDLGMVCEQLGDHVVAHSAFQQCCKLMPNDSFCRDAVWRTSPFWWSSPRGRRLSLRRWQPGDEPYLKRCWADSDFMEKYNLVLGYDHKRQEQFLENLPGAITRSPVINQSLDWLILTHDSRPLGMLSLTRLNASERSAEYLVGFPEPPGYGYALEASLLALDFAFRVAGLSRLTSAVYANNPRAQSNTLHLGFRQEQLVKSKMHHPGSGEAIDFYINSLSRTEYLSNRQLQAWTRRARLST